MARVAAALSFVACSRAAAPVEAWVPAPAPSCRPAAPDARAVRSADGQVIVFVQADPSRTDSTTTGDVPHQDLCIARGSAEPHVIVAGRGAPEDGGAERTLADFDNLLLSRDAAVLYFTTAAWVTSSAAHAVDLRTGKERFLVDGAVTATLDDGPYRGMLLVASMRLDPAHPVGSPKYRGRMEVWSVVGQDGKTVRMLPEDDAERRHALHE